VTLALALSVVLTGDIGVLAQNAPPKPQPSPEQRARESWARMSEASSLLWHLSTIRQYAMLEGDPILEHLIAAYKEPPAEPREHLRYLLASALRARYEGYRPLAPVGVSPARLRGQRAPTMSDADREALLALVQKGTGKDPHAWALFNAAFALTRGPKADEGEAIAALLEIATDDKSTVRRASVIEGLSRAGHEEFLSHIPALMTEKIRKAPDRVLIREAAAWAAARLARPILAPPPPPPAPKQAPGAKKPAPKPPPRPKMDPERLKRARTAMAAVIDALEEKKVMPRTKRALGLALQYSMATDTVFEDLESWRIVLEGSGGRTGSTESTTVARFMGIETSGERIAFLLDASDSMLNPLTAEEKAALERLIVPKDEGGKKKKRGRSTRARRGPQLADVSSATNRFEAAREHLKHTLLEIDQHAAFVIVLFGNKAELLSATPQLVRATRPNVLRVIEALDAIQPGPANTAREHGTLKGQTNIFGAFELAMRVSIRGTNEEMATYVDKRMLGEGVDTVFLLSDGKPTRDGFSGVTPETEIGGYWREAYEGETTDPETGQKRKVKWDRQWIPKRKQKLGHGVGPFVQYDPFLEEVTRMNMFRRVQIHVISIGEADKVLPRRLADAGRGKWIDLSGPKEQEEGK
jgi:hypothetical protein